MPERPRISEACDLYAESSRARGLAEGTIRNRSQAVRLLIPVTRDVQVESLTPVHIERVFAHYSWAPTTRNVRLGIYRHFFAWCRARRYMSRDNDPVIGWRSERVPEKERTRIPVQEWGRLFDAAANPRERITLALGLYLFLRASEIQGIQLRSLDLQNSLIEVNRPKTRQRDLMPISSELDRYLRQHLTWLTEQGFAEPDFYLLPASAKRYERDERNRWIAGTGGFDPSRPFTHAHRLVQRVLDRAGYVRSPGEGVHTLRRSGARAYFDSLVDQSYDGALRRVQAMLGHRNAFMTEVYLGLDLDRATRNADLAGKPMFPDLTSGVTELRGARGM